MSPLRVPLSTSGVYPRVFTHSNQAWTIADGRLKQLERVDDLVIEPRGPAAAPTLRDPATLVDLAFNGLV